MALRRIAKNEDPASKPLQGWPQRLPVLNKFFLWVSGFSFSVFLSDQGYVSMVRNQGCVVTKYLYGIYIYIGRSRLPVKCSIPGIGNGIRRKIAFLEYDLSPSVINGDGWNYIQSGAIHDEMIIHTVSIG